MLKNINYDDIDEKQKQHLLKLIDFLYNEIKETKKDGLWYCKYDDIENIFLIIKEYNLKLDYPWKLRYNNEIIDWYNNQGWLTITNDETVYNRESSWQQILIKYQ